jgi:hypothetical protein
MIFFSMMLLGLVMLAQANLHRARGRIMLLQAQYAAESGADAAIAYLNSGNTSYTGTSSDVQVLNAGKYKATYAVTVAAGANAKEKIITATGKVYDPATKATPTYSRKIRVTAQRTTTTTASSILSRNIVSVSSGVKTLSAKEIYVNGFIQLNKNTTDLIAEKISVAGRDTSSANCSIEGTGNLVKPTSFSDPTQTKTILNLAYSNCISPPGNTSNADFTVNANQTNISTIQSTYIPWDLAMDGSYQSSPSGCNDWNGSGTITIPSTGNTKKTHYPDSSSGIASTCGTSGNLNLSSNTYVLSDSVHIRANLCATTACNPTFTNPAASTVYMFVEGTVNFESVKTTTGSGPIVLISYGTDPASKTSVCPYGGAVYLGQGGSGYTEAPALYMLAQNGLCIDGTKFGTSGSGATAPMLGGIAGKNLYVNSSPSTPRPLKLDPAFPVSAVPLDLSWRETYYERL